MKETIACLACTLPSIGRFQEESKEILQKQYIHGRLEQSQEEHTQKFETIININYTLCTFRSIIDLSFPSTLESGAVLPSGNTTLIQLAPSLAIDQVWTFNVVYNSKCGTDRRVEPIGVLLLIRYQLFILVSHNATQHGIYICIHPPDMDAKD